MGVNNKMKKIQPNEKHIEGLVDGADKMIAELERSKKTTDKEYYEAVGFIRGLETALSIIRKNLAE